MIQTDFPRALVVAIIIIPKTSKFVLIQEAKSSCRAQWSLPGGKVEPGESLASGVIREAKEETGLVVIPRGIQSIEHRRIEESDEVETPFERFLFVVVADPAGGYLKTEEDPESIQAAFLTSAEVGNLNVRGGGYLKYIRRFEEGAALLPMDAYRFDIG